MWHWRKLIVSTTSTERIDVFFHCLCSLCRKCVGIEAPDLPFEDSWKWLSRCTNLKWLKGLRETFFFSPDTWIDKWSLFFRLNLPCGFILYFKGKGKCKEAYIGHRSSFSLGPQPSYTHLTDRGSRDFNITWDKAWTLIPWSALLALGSHLHPSPPLLHGGLTRSSWRSWDQACHLIKAH